MGAQPFWVGLFYTVNAIAGILVSLWLAKRSDSQGDRRKLILFCCAMAIGNALLFAFNRHYLTLLTCGCCWPRSPIPPCRSFLRSPVSTRTARRGKW